MVSSKKFSANIEVLEEEKALELSAQRPKVVSTTECSDPYSWVHKEVLSL